MRFASIEYIKSVPFMLVVWTLWFLPNSDGARTAMRERLVAALLCAVPIMLITRLLANYLLPFSFRPIHTDGLDLRLFEWQRLSVLYGWNSMPSAHASHFVGLAMAILLIHRGFGVFLLAWAVLVVSVPRIVLGLHWPSDIVVGAGIGVAFAVVLLEPITRLVRTSGLVPFFEAREMIGYPLLFLVTYELSRMFEFTRYLI